MMTWIQGMEVADLPVTIFTPFLNRISIKNMSVASPDIPICIFGGGKIFTRRGSYRSCVSDDRVMIVLKISVVFPCHERRQLPHVCPNIGFRYCITVTLSSLYMISTVPQNFFYTCTNISLRSVLRNIHIAGYIDITGKKSLTIE